jgi:hypothetical protein
MSNDDDIVRPETIAFIMERLKQHNCVSDFVRTSDREFEIKRTCGDVIHLYITAKYVFGFLDVNDVLQTNPDTNCIMLASSWLNYTSDAKDLAKESQVGLFDMGEFLGALNREHGFWNYKKPEKKKPS